MTSQDHRIKKILTDRPAPMLTGLYSVQAVSADPSQPDVTIYRARATHALEWKAMMALRGRFSYFMLRHAADAWDVYDSEGEEYALCNDVVGNPVSDCPDVCVVDRGELLQEAREAIMDDQIAQLAVAECHAGASAVDHSNLAALNRKMIGDADKRDLEQLYIVDSKVWGCRVLGLYANVARLSEEMQNVYMDRFEWISKRWPTLKEHHLTVFADRLAKARGKYLLSVLDSCVRRAAMSTDVSASMAVRWHVAPLAARSKFANCMVRALYGAIRLPNDGPETFDVTKVDHDTVMTLLDDFRATIP